jgi:nucleoid-associated protein YgaU
VAESANERPASLVTTSPVPAPAVAAPQTTRAATPSRPTAPAGRTHTVAPKETLYGISVRYYGNGKQVDAIYQANRDQMRSREDVRPGMVLRLPEGAAKR